MHRRGWALLSTPIAEPSKVLSLLKIRRLRLVCIGFLLKANSPISSSASGYSSYQPLHTIDKIKPHIEKFSHLCCMNLFVPNKGLIDFATIVTSHYDPT